MRRTLHRHPQALSDVEESAVFIGQEAPEAALRFIEAVEATLRLLTENPELGPARECERSELAGLRFFPVKGFDKHLIFYRTNRAGIEIIRVLYGTRDIEPLLE